MECVMHLNVKNEKEKKKRTERVRSKSLRRAKKKIQSYAPAPIHKIAKMNVAYAHQFDK